MGMSDGMMTENMLLVIAATMVANARITVVYILSWN